MFGFRVPSSQVFEFPGLRVCLFSSFWVLGLMAYGLGSRVGTPRQPPFIGSHMKNFQSKKKLAMKLTTQQDLH